MASYQPLIDDPVEAATASSAYVPTVMEVEEELMLTRPERKPDNVAGCCCPAGSMYNHEKKNSRWRYLGVLEILLHLLVVVAWSYEKQMVNTYVGQHLADEDVQKAVGNPMDMENAEQLTHEIFSDCEVMTLSAIYNIWVLWNVVIRVVFFCVYSPRTVAVNDNVDDNDEMTLYEPTWIAKLFFPLSTVYYHEGNAFNIKTFLACCFGPWFALCCYKPTYKTHAMVYVSESELPAATAVKQV